MGNIFSKIIGSKLALLRQGANLALRDLALQLNVGIDTLIALEHPYKDANPSLKGYFLYLQYFEIYFSDIFDNLKTDEAHKYMNQRSTTEFLLNSVKEAVLSLQRDDQKVTYDTISKYLQIPISRLKENAEIQSFMKLYKAKDKNQIKHNFNENKLLEDAMAAMKQLQISKSLITQAAICRTMGISHTLLKYYPCVKAYLEEQIRNDFRRNIESLGENEQEILSTVKSIIYQRKVRQQEISFGGVAKDLQLNTDLLYECPTIVSLIEHAVDERKPLRRREQELLLAMKEIVATYRISKVDLTLQYLAEAIGLGPPRLYYYPAVLALARQAVEEANQELAHDANIFERAKEAIQQLHISGKPITLCAVARELDMSTSGLFNYSKVRALIYEEKKKKHPMRNEQMIIERVQIVIATLIEKEERITIKAVAKELGVSTTYLYYYDNAMVKIKTAIEGEDYIAKRKEQHRYQLLLDVQGAIERLRTKKEQLTIKAISKEVGKERTTLGLYPEIISYIKCAVSGGDGEVDYPDL